MDQQYDIDQSVNPAPEFPMKWHKFLIYFSLWAGAVLCVINGLMLLTGMHYGGGSDTRMVYAFYSGLQAVDMIIGLVYLACAVAYIITRFKLAKLERKGAKLVVLIPMIMAALNLIYPLLASMVTGLSMGDLMDSSAIGSIVGGVALSIYNKKYYEERDSILID